MGELPSAPSDGGFSRRPGRFNDERSHQNAPGGPVTIDQSRLPTCAPYTAFIGNLPFDIADGDVRTFFQMRNITAGAILNVKLPRDTAENKSRGFGYVDFATCEDLTRALLASNQYSIRNRVVRVDMSDSKPQNDRELRPAEASRNWRDGAVAGSGSSLRNSQMATESRPVSVADASRNWRDGAKPMEKSAFREEPHDQRHSMPPRAEPVIMNWRDSAKPVEKKPISLEQEENSPVVNVPVPSTSAPPRPEPSKVPQGSWRRG